MVTFLYIFSNCKCICAWLFAYEISLNCSGDEQFELNVVFDFWKKLKKEKQTEHPLGCVLTSGQSNF